MPGKPRILVVSQVMPFPRKSGQEQRVYYKLRALREYFHLTFLSSIDERRIPDVRQRLLELSDDVLLLPSNYSRTIASRYWNKLLGEIYALQKGLKFSNYLVGCVELTPPRVEHALGAMTFDCALFEYWHAVGSAAALRRRGIPCVLDMHDILWRSYSRQLDASATAPGWWKRRLVAKYREREEAAWREFDALIAINDAERQYVSDRMPRGAPVYYAPMGTDLAEWPYSWEPAQPPRIAYYGGLGSRHNQRDALLCYQRIMPLIWRQYPSTELWLFGGNPPAFLRDLALRESRVKVPGYLPRVQDELRRASVVLCPWSGTYGFRSRLVEVMALGIPVVASPEAVYGMTMDDRRGIFLEGTPEAMAQSCWQLLAGPDLARQQSRLAREQVEEKFGYDRTYGKLARELWEFASQMSSQPWIQPIGVGSQ